MAHQGHGWTTYTSTFYTANSQFDLKCSANTATQNASAVGAFPIHNNFWFEHRDSLRMVYGRDGNTRYTDSMVCLYIASPIASIGANFSDSNGNNYTVFGLRNERVRIREYK